MFYQIGKFQSLKKDFLKKQKFQQNLQNGCHQVKQRKTTQLSHPKGIYIPAYRKLVPLRRFR